MDISYLKRKLLEIDSRGYKNYKRIEGDYKIDENFTLQINHAQSDPFASFSKLTIIANLSATNFPEDLFNNFIRRVAFQDYILRKFKSKIMKFSKIRGTGKSGLYSVDAGNQEIVYRSGCEVIDNKLIIRFFCGLPASGRTIKGKTASQMLTGEIPQCLPVLNFANHNRDEIYEFVNHVEDVELIRKELLNRNLIAFIGNNSILPRKSGIDEKPLEKGAIPVEAPEELEVEIETKYHGKIKGIGIPEGVTLIVGGGFHGKSTLLNAIAKGIYPHIKGDGREWVVSHPETVKVRSEDGRAVNGVNISPFIKDLPMKKSTSFFTTENASGSTSVAANIIEALEIGAKVLLIDEDTTATNFLIRDFRIQKLIPKEKEPITPFIDKVKKLYEEYGVSTIIVIGGSGDYLNVADRVISVENYKIFDRTKKAHDIIKEYPYFRKIESKDFGNISKRIVLKESFNFKKVKVRSKKEILLDKNVIDISQLEQIIDFSQTKFIAEIIKKFAKEIDEKKTITEILEHFENEFMKKGFKMFYKSPPGDLSFTRKFEISSAINRLRSLKVKHS